MQSTYRDALYSILKKEQEISLETSHVIDEYAAPQKTYNFLCEFKIGLKTLN
ncbi:hypothetical protein [Flavobacterium xanthum]|uniref:Uncharacterized protein n=1 Tax=Flavobacterium xanthum TaxID=69322 RepID=A0A1M7LYG6_9FLAO|nr:hypothetical protein [Flavobacterium xanthum]SHM83373.1 hypothetical protein SAMN05443669_10982 [Flavobacterium xanthum]